MDFNSLLQRVEEKFVSPVTLCLGILAFITLFASIDGFTEKFISSTQMRGFIYLLVVASWIAIWMRNRFILPRVKKNRIGIVIAIYAENEAERRSLKADFIAKLRKSLRDEKILDFAEVLFLKNHFAQQIFESDVPINNIGRMNQKIHAHFYVWGNIKKRPDGDPNEKYFLNFQGYVTHKPVADEIQQELSKDFSAVLPNEISFSEREFRGFEASAQIVHLAAKYIIGLAAYISQDPKLAFRFHDGLRQQFNMFRPLPLHLQDIRNKIPLLLSEEAFWIARWHEAHGRLTECEKFVEKALSENSNSYGGWLLKARLDFNKRKIDSAFQSITKAERYGGSRGEWRYSKAFLCFWMSDFQKAMRVCNKIKSQPYDGELDTCEEVIAFNLKILETDNSKPQLYFWIGYLSYFKKCNLGDAFTYFEKFEEFADSSMTELESKSSAYLTEIRRKMDIPNQSPTS